MKYEWPFCTSWLYFDVPKIRVSLLTATSSGRETR